MRTFLLIAVLLSGCFAPPPNSPPFWSDLQAAQAALDAYRAVRGAGRLDVQALRLSDRVDDYCGEEVRYGCVIQLPPSPGQDPIWIVFHRGGFERAPLIIHEAFHVIRGNHVADTIFADPRATWLGVYRTEGRAPTFQDHWHEDRDLWGEITDQALRLYRARVR